MARLMPEPLSSEPTEEEEEEEEEAAAGQVERAHSRGQHWSLLRRRLRMHHRLLLLPERVRAETERPRPLSPPYPLRLTLRAGSPKPMCLLCDPNRLVQGLASGFSPTIAVVS